MKIKKFFQKNKFIKKAFALVACIAVMACMSVPAFAASEGADSAVAVSAVQSIFDDLTATVNVSSILSAIGIALGASVLLFFFWWALRKVIKMVMAAFRKGKVSV